MWLEAVVAEPGGDGTGGKVTRNEKGTPESGVISPLLKNLFLHWFDALFHGPEGPSRWADARLAGYADDMVILAREWTGELTDWVEARLEGKFGLEINREKTRVVEVKPGLPWVRASMGPDRLNGNREAGRTTSAPGIRVEHGGKSTGSYATV